jgi:glycosyltransferase involved in cell wall biosynthesis
MRLLVLTSSYPKFPGDGTAPFIERIVTEVARRGHEVDVVLPRHPELVTDGRRGGHALRFFPFYAGPARPYVWGYATSMQADTRVRALALAVAPVASFCAWRLMRERIGSARYDLVHAHWALPNGPVAALAASAARLPLVVSLHGSDVFVAERSGPLRAVGRGVFRRSAWVNACSHDLAERVRAMGLTPDVPEVLPYGVDLPERGIGDGAVWRARLGAGPEDFVVAAAGRLVAKKGFTHLVRAAAILRSQGVPVRVALAGSGDLGPALASQIYAERCEASVSLLGNLSHRDVGGVFAAADAVAIPSVRDERGNVDGLPNVLLEAMAAGSAIIASQVGGIPDVVETERNGLLVPPGDAPALAAALQRVKGDPELRSRLGSGARETAREHSWTAYGDRLIRGYERVLAATRAS